MATSKPDILIILLQKLMEEGNVMYKVSKCLLFLCCWWWRGTTSQSGIGCCSHASVWSRYLAGMEFQNVPTLAQEPANLQTAESSWESTSLCVGEQLSGILAAVAVAS